GETSAPPAKGRIPRNAEALPAAFPCRCMPSEKDVVLTMPTLDTTRNLATISNQNDSSAKTASSKRQLPITEITIPANKTVSSFSYTASFPVTCSAILMHKPFTAKTIENCCGLMSYIFCRTNGAPEIYANILFMSKDLASAIPINTRSCNKSQIVATKTNTLPTDLCY